MLLVGAVNANNTVKAGLKSALYVGLSAAPDGLSTESVIRTGNASIREDGLTPVVLCGIVR